MEMTRSSDTDISPSSQNWPQISSINFPSLFLNEVLMKLKIDEMPEKVTEYVTSRR